MASNSYEEKCDELRQRHHVLMLTLKSKQASIDFLRSDFEAVREEMKKKSENLLAKNQREYDEKISKIANEIDFRQSKTEELRENNKKLELSIDVLKSKLKNISARDLKAEKFEDDVQNLRKNIVEAKNYGETLQHNIQRKGIELKNLEDKKKELEENVESVEMTIEVKDELIREFKDSIQNHKEKMEEMREKFEKCQFENVDVGKKGNSVFSEIEDRKNYLKQRTSALKLICERIEREVERQKFELKRTTEQMKSWSLNLTDDRATNKELMTLLQKCNDVKKYIDKLHLMKKNYPDVILLSLDPRIKPDEQKARNHLDYLRFLNAEGQKRLKIERLRVINQKDTLRKLIVHRKMLQMELKDRETKKTEEQPELNFLETVKKPELVNKMTVRFAEPVNEKVELEKGVKLEKAKKREKNKPVSLGEPVIEPCKQQ